MISRGAERRHRHFHLRSVGNTAITIGSIAMWFASADSTDIDARVVESDRKGWCRAAGTNGDDARREIAHRTR
jgi:hypothetical protein